MVLPVALHSLQSPPHKAVRLSGATLCSQSVQCLTVQNVVRSMHTTLSRATSPFILSHAVTRTRVPESRLRNHLLSSVDDALYHVVNYLLFAWAGALQELVVTRSSICGHHVTALSHAP